MIVGTNRRRQVIGVISPRLMEQQFLELNLRRRTHSSCREIIPLHYIVQG